jgi:aspartyl-tRNA(Asn)/glutamyl-tRNA(Gln) amidotransferase subunit B
MPGTLPVFNKRALEFIVKMSLACNCRINEISRFARKNYYYPDLPKNYQISQYEAPVAEHGWIEIETTSGPKKIGITRIHMEEDAGKLIHDENRPYSLVDLNRTGVPLMEIVSEPDIATPEEASSYLKSLRAALIYLGICDGNMEEGSFRCDANVSLRPAGAKGLGVKTELKNMNSFRNVQKALQYEIERQTEILDDGQVVIQDTRLFNPSTGTTASMRTKEQAHDYRYFPDPDLLPLKIEPELIERMRSDMPELPNEKKARFVEEYAIPAYDAEVLTASRDLADYFEATAKLFKNYKQISNWIMTELLRELKGEGDELAGCLITPDMLARMLKMIEDGTISGKIAKTVFEEMYSTGKDPSEIVEEKGLKQVSDESELQTIIGKILDDHPEEVSKYLGGKKQLQGFFVGQVMKATRGKANPKLVNQLLEEELKNRES